MTEKTKKLEQEHSESAAESGDSESEDSESEWLPK